MASSKKVLQKDPLQCEHCNQTFKYNSKLTRHLLTHTKSKEFKCKYCDAAFSLTHNLKVHMRIHLGLKPFKCAYPGCDKSFTQSCNMNVHMKTHGFNQSRIIFRRYETVGTEFEKTAKNEDKGETKRIEETHASNDEIMLESGPIEDDKGRCYEEIREFDQETDGSDDIFTF